MKNIIRTIALTIAAALSLTMAACTQDNNSKGQNMKKDKKALVVFFSRAGENYGVGNVEKGNTRIIAEMIAAKTGAGIFQIEPVTPYPENYDECTEVAKKELDTNARPAVKGDIRIEDYDVVFIGYPNWWGDMPMPVYTFIGKHNWQGKTVIPFCTHEGSGIGGTGKKLGKACKGASVEDGFAIRGATAQNERGQAEAAVADWLRQYGF